MITSGILIWSFNINPYLYCIYMLRISNFRIFNY